MILITGATGTIGSEIVRLLAALGEGVRAVTRNPETADLPGGVEVVRGDYSDVPAIAGAMDGADAVFVLSVLGPEGIDADTALVRAASDAGVRRIVKLSAIGTGDPGLGRVGTWHLPGEQAVRDSGTDWTILRPSSFASNTLSWAPALHSGQPVSNLTGAGAQGVVDPRDVSAVAVEALLFPAHAGRVYTLTGPELLTTHDQAAVVAAAYLCRVGRRPCLGVRSGSDCGRLAVVLMPDHLVVAAAHPGDRPGPGPPKACASRSRVTAAWNSPCGAASLPVA
ncbi:SDR family oxidoreductase [Nocardia carnea]|uniref:SDR family oxidoreductase n=1 Tax=Nocardia carnea TaxID=37328 RepID=A0ABW7TKY1_9NOCA|nr:NAD(P)H-binding protein [Nocardia carnea]